MGERKGTEPVNKLWTVMQICMDKKMMVRFSSFPGGHRSLGIYDNEGQARQFLYEAKSLEDLEQQVEKDFDTLIGVNPPLPKVLPIPRMPLPPGFPKP